MFPFQARTRALQFLAAATLLSSCVDQAYDLSHVDTDKITIGDQLILPLGHGEIAAGEFLNIGPESDISVDEAGNYVISYPGTIDLQVPQDVRLDDFPLEEVSAPLDESSLSDGSLPPEEAIRLTRQEVAIAFKETDEILRIDSIRFNTENDRSRFRVEVRLAGATLTDGQADLAVRITFPEGYGFQPSGTSGVTSDGNRVTILLPLGQLAGKSRQIDLPLDRAVIRGADRIVYQIELIPGKTGATLHVAPNAEIRLTSTLQSLAYTYIYGDFSGQYAMPSAKIVTSRLNEIFEGEDNVLAFYDPHLRLETESNIGVPLEIAPTLVATSDRTGEQKEVSTVPVVLTAPASGGETKFNHLWLGARRESAEAINYTFTECSGINGLIRLLPDRMQFGASVSAVPASEGEGARFFPAAPYAKIKYTAVIPVAPARDFRASTSQTVKNAFDKTLIDYLFTGGSVEIGGQVTNSLPVNLEMNLVILDEAGTPVGIEFPAQQIRGCPRETKGGVVSPVRFSIGEHDMARMVSARHLKITLRAGSDATLEGAPLRPDQEVKLDLKVKRTGGIVLPA